MIFLESVNTQILCLIILKWNYCRLIRIPVNLHELHAPDYYVHHYDFDAHIQASDAEASFVDPQYDGFDYPIYLIYSPFFYSKLMVSWFPWVTKPASFFPFFLTSFFLIMANNHDTCFCYNIGISDCQRMLLHYAMNPIFFNLLLMSNFLA